MKSPQRGPKPRSKPGPKPLSPSEDTRRQVEFGVSSGFQVAKLARLFGIPRQTFNRMFADEIENGRMRLTIKMVACLHDAALDGNVASAKALLGFVERSGAKVKADPPPVVVNPFAGLTERYWAQNANLGVSKTQEK